MSKSKAQHAKRSGPIRALVGGIVYWMPVWVPLVLLWQVVDRGLRPAREEARRLAGEEQTVATRYSNARASFERMHAEAKAWTDPIYRERVRRLRLAEAGQAAAGQAGAGQATTNGSEASTQEGR